MRDDNETAIQRNWADLIAAIAAHQDKAAFKALFEFFAPRIKGMLLRGGASNDAAEDIAQEALVTVFHKASYYDPDRAGVSAWVYTIARNIRIDRLRRDQRAKKHMLYEVHETEAPERSDARLDASERQQRVREALDQLPDEQARVVELSYFDGLAHGDIASRLGIPLGTVKSRLRLATTRLREFLSDFQ